MIMSKFEGYVSLSSLERSAASKYYLFNFVNVFLGSIIAGSAFEQLDTFIKQPANKYVFIFPVFIIWLRDDYFQIYCLQFLAKIAMVTVVHHKVLKRVN